MTVADSTGVLGTLVSMGLPNLKSSWNKPYWMLLLVNILMISPFVIWSLQFDRLGSADLLVINSFINILN